MAKKENKIVEELRRRGKIFEDPAPKESDNFIGMIDPAPSIIGLLKRMFFNRKSQRDIFLDALTSFETSFLLLCNRNQK